MEKKLNFFGQIYRMQDGRLIKQVVFGTIDGKTKEEDRKEDGRMTYWTGATRILANCRDWRWTGRNGDIS